MGNLNLELDTPELMRRYEELSANRQYCVGAGLLDKLALRRGERVLDVGSGTGELAERACLAVGPDGFVLGVEPLPLRVNRAIQRGRANLSFRLGDAESLGDLEDGSFDVVYLNEVFHWILNKKAALRQLGRLLKPNGRLGLTTGLRDASTVNPSPRRRVLSREPYCRHVDATRAFAHHVSIEELEELFLDAGLSAEATELETSVTYHATAEEMIDFCQASSFGNYLGALPSELVEAARRELAVELELMRTADGICQKGVRLMAIARKVPASLVSTRSTATS